LQLIVLADTVQEARNTEAELLAAKLDKLSDGLILASETTYIVHRERVEKRLTDFVSAMSAQEYHEMGFEPRMTGYSKDRIREEFPWKKFLVVRQDRYTFGTAIAVDGVQEIAQRAWELFLSPQLLN
jgi:hypothetical protein